MLKQNNIDFIMLIAWYFHFILFDPLSRFPQRGKALMVLLPPWGKAGKGVITN
jgi:hypothetical protein